MSADRVRVRGAVPGNLAKGALTAVALVSLAAGGIILLPRWAKAIRPGFADFRYQGVSIEYPDWENFLSSLKQIGGHRTLLATRREDCSFVFTADVPALADQASFWAYLKGANIARDPGGLRGRTTSLTLDARHGLIEFDFGFDKKGYHSAFYSVRSGGTVYTAKFTSGADRFDRGCRPYLTRTFASLAAD